MGSVLISEVKHESSLVGFYLLSPYIIYYGCLSANEVLVLGHLTAVKPSAKKYSQAPPIPIAFYS